MNKKNSTPKENVMYVKLSSYYANYLKTRYGDPIVFHDKSIAKQCIYLYIVQNQTMRCITPFCVSESAFNYKDENQPFTINAYRPDIEERKQFVAITIPKEVIRFNRIVETSSYWQLSSSGTQLFRNEIKNEFWTNFSFFYDDCRLRSQKLGYSVTFEDVMSDFMVMHNIDMKIYENMMRYWYRILPEMQNRAQLRRDSLETKTGCVFTYTE